MLFNKQESVRNVLGGQAFATISLPYGVSLTVKGDLNNSTSNNKKYDNPEIGDGATNGGRLTSYAYQYRPTTLQEIVNWSTSSITYIMLKLWQSRKLQLGT